MTERGWQKLIALTGNVAEPIADSSTDFLQNFTLSISSKIPLKPSKIQFLFKLTRYRIPYRKTPYKSGIISIYIPIFQFSKFQNSNPKIKNSRKIQYLFDSTLSLKNPFKKENK